MKNIKHVKESENKKDDRKKKKNTIGKKSPGRLMEEIAERNRE